MKKANLRVAGLAGRKALASASICVCAAAVVTPATAGVITFIGALTAPPFGISVSSSPGARGSTASHDQVTDASGRTIYVSFIPEPNNPSSAELSVSIDGPATRAGTLTTRFSDAKGRRAAPGTGGTYHIGTQGGTLSMRAPDDASSGTRVTLTTNYL